MLFTHDTEVALAAAAALVNTMPGSVPGDGDPDRLTTLDELEALFREPRGGPAASTATPRELEAVRALRPRLRGFWDARRDRRRRPRQRAARRGPRRPPARRPRRRRLARPRHPGRRPARPADGRRGRDRRHRRRARRRAGPAARLRGRRLRRRRRRPLPQPLAPLLRGRLRGPGPHRRLPRPPRRATPEDPTTHRGRMPPGTRPAAYALGRGRWPLRPCRRRGSSPSRPRRPP